MSRIERAGRVNTAGNFGAEHSLEEPGCRVRVGATQMNVIVTVFAHRRSPILLCRIPAPRPRMAVTSDFREPISLHKADLFLPKHHPPPHLPATLQITQCGA